MSEDPAPSNESSHLVDKGNKVINTVSKVSSESDQTAPSDAGPSTNAQAPAPTPSGSGIIQDHDDIPHQSSEDDSESASDSDVREPTPDEVEQSFLSGQAPLYEDNELLSQTHKPDVWDTLPPKELRSLMASLDPSFGNLMREEVQASEEKFIPLDDDGRVIQPSRYAQRFKPSPGRVTVYSRYNVSSAKVVHQSGSLSHKIFSKYVPTLTQIQDPEDSGVTGTFCPLKGVRYVVARVPLNVRGRHAWMFYASPQGRVFKGLTLAVVDTGRKKDAKEVVADVGKFTRVEGEVPDGPFLDSDGEEEPSVEYMDMEAEVPNMEVMVAENSLTFHDYIEDRRPGWKSLMEMGMAEFPLYRLVKVDSDKFHVSKMFSRFGNPAPGTLSRVMNMITAEGIKQGDITFKLAVSILLHAYALGTLPKKETKEVKQLFRLPNKGPKVTYSPKPNHLPHLPVQRNWGMAVAARGLDYVSAEGKHVRFVFLDNAIGFLNLRPGFNGGVMGFKGGDLMSIALRVLRKIEQA